MLILFIGVLSFSTSKTVAFVEITKEPISGNAEIVQDTLKDINHYIPNIKNNNPEVVSNSKIDYAIKPEITSTESREERDRSEQQKKLAQQRNVYSRNRASYSQNINPVNFSSGKSNNNYAFGYCTWYAAQRRPDLPNQLGNGGRWYNSAQQLGLSTGKEPESGAVIVTRESWAGHVGYVESVSENTVTITEMNFNGWNRVNTRTIDKNSAIIKGYIY